MEERNVEIPIGEDTAPKAVKESVERNWSLIGRLALGLLIAVFFLVFVFQNSAKTEVKFLSWDFELATSILILLCGVAGVVVWELAGFVSRRARR